jgi:hypothetical protein
MARKTVLVLVCAAIFAQGAFAAPDFSKYQYFYIDKNAPHWGIYFTAYETEVIDGFEAYGLKYLSEKQLKSLSAAEQDKVLMLRFDLKTKVTISFIDYSSERAVASCTGKFGSASTEGIKKGVINAIKDAGKLLVKK